MRFLKLAAVAISLALAAPALAVTQVSSEIAWTSSDVNRLLVMNMDGYSSEALDTNISARFAMRLTGVTFVNNVQSWTFRFFVQNTTNNPPVFNRMSAFGFDINNSASLADITSADLVNGGGVYTRVAYNANVPQINPRLDLCFAAGGQNGCAGGGNAGLTPGESAAGGIFRLNFTGQVAQVVMDNFFTRVQAMTGSNGPSGITLVRQLPGGSKDITFNVNPIGVPEPGIWAQLIAGFAAIGVSLRRRARRITA